MKNINIKLIQKAYKKLKSNIYFDKTQLILRDKLVRFECDNNLEEYFEKIAFMLEDEKVFQQQLKKILKSISVNSFPKNLEADTSISRNIIMNSAEKNIKIKDLQHMIDMSIEGHILSVLWILLIGYRVDEEVYEHSYGNRIRSNLINKATGQPTYSPYLFKPYFEQYESWRDTAMDEASKHLRQNQDVVIITMDFKRYYYSVDMGEEAFEQIYKDAFENEDTLKEETIQDDMRKRLNRFVCAVVQRYSELLDKNLYEGRRVLPIGFLPSNVIANWYLKNFDKAIVDGWNPIYFGRYVDDVIIVDKVERNSDIYTKAQKDEIKAEDVINYFLVQCSRWHGLGNGENCKKNSGNALLQIDEEETAKINQDKRPGEGLDVVYKVNNKYSAIPNDNSKINVQNDKVKIFYFKRGETDALLTCFRKVIAKNKSEFRHMPEDEAIFQEDNYDEIYRLNNNDSPNKFRSVSGISIDKYELSKFIGKYLRIGGMINDVIESRFEKDIQKIFNFRVIIENYTVWEKVVEIFVINEKFDAVEKFVKNIISAIQIVEYSGEDTTNATTVVKCTLLDYLYSSIFRAFSLVWKTECINTLENLVKELKSLSRELELNGAYSETIWEELSEGFREERFRYLETRMVDKSVMPVFLDMLEYERIINENTEINLTHFYEEMRLVRSKWLWEYRYYPYMVTMYDFSMIASIEQLDKDEKNPFDATKEIIEEQKERYLQCNYWLGEEYVQVKPPIKAQKMDLKNRDAFLIEVGEKKKSKLSIAVANVKLNHKNFELLIKEKPNRTYDRYFDLKSVVNAAIDQKVDMLIMPESYVPYEWLSFLAKKCAQTNLAIVTGVEHVKCNDKIYNLTAVILPYVEETYRCAVVTFHLKTHYAPNEKREIRGYRLQEVEGHKYELYKWNGCYFPVYCCYELASIYDRALFQAYADFLVAIEWNKDVNYYSNILESLSRDIHCYCIQVNSSDYGDSRITKPSKTEEKDIIRTKGGQNSTILVDSIDIEKLREFQFKEYELQRQDKQFKATPPDFRTEIIEKKIKGKSIME